MRGEQKVILKVLGGKREKQVVATSDHMNSWLTKIANY